MVYDIQVVIRRCYNRICCMDCVVYYVYGYLYKEIGKMVGILVNIVRSCIFYGWELLRNELDLIVKQSLYILNGRVFVCKICLL